jgi:hypothetical protein
VLPFVINVTYFAADLTGIWNLVIPANAGIQKFSLPGTTHDDNALGWMPACAGMTHENWLVDDYQNTLP